MRTFSAKAENVKSSWFLIDATGHTLGRLATKIAFRLMGKHKPEYTPHVDTGDHIVVINASQIQVTKDKAKTKIYYRHTGYPGGIKEVTLEKLQKQWPDRILLQAVKGMLSKNSLGRQMIKKLKVYGDSDHPHISQQPMVLEI